MSQRLNSTFPATSAAEVGPAPDLDPALFAIVDAYLREKGPDALLPVMPKPTATASEVPPAGPAGPALPDAGLSDNAVPDGAAPEPGAARRQRRPLDWHSVAFHLGRGVPVQVVADIMGCSVRRIRRHFDRSRRFRALIQECQRHRAEVARRRLADVIAEVAPAALKRALEANSPTAVAFAARQLTAAPLGLEGAAWGEQEPWNGGPPPAEKVLQSLLWKGDK